MHVEIYPDRACYRPHEPVQLLVTISDFSQDHVYLEASITHLNNCLARLTQTIATAKDRTVTASFEWLPPAVCPRGYGVDLQANSPDGYPLARTSTAFDVLEQWTQAPRYGFLSDFRPSRNDFEATAAWLARYHINGVQFYDWMYRHDQLLPPSDTFSDPLGRPLSLATVKGLIDAIHRRNVAAMPYTAVYAASRPFYSSHPDWALFQANGEPYAFADFLMIMNPEPDSAWTQHLLSQFRSVLTETAFDGIHLDQYGQPRSGYDAAGRVIDLSQTLPGFIDVTRQVVLESYGQDGTVIFNAVANWPIEAVARAGQDLVYIEIWPPDTGFWHLHQYVVTGQQLGEGKPVVMACYIDPNWRHAVLLADAAIFASGGFHIELGEPGGMLADPYFPKYGVMGQAQAAAVRAYYDFVVRYENVLAVGTHDTSGARAVCLDIEGIETSTSGQANTVWVVTRAGNGFETISFINLRQVTNPVWNEDQPEPQPVTNLRTRYNAGYIPRRVWWASPDTADCQACSLDFDVVEKAGEQFLEFTVPLLKYWDLIVLER